MRVAWLSDLHLNFVEPESAREFFASVRDLSPDAVVLTGDVADGRTIHSTPASLASVVACPVYFVLGNHDFYHSSIAAVRSGLLTEPNPRRLRYLPREGIVQLAPGVALVGHDGWADGRNGNYLGTRVELNDFRLIEEFRGLGPAERYRLMPKLADEAARYFAELIPIALATSRHVLLATHVPPFAEAAFHQGQPSSPDYLPFFSSRSVGEALLEVMMAHPECQLTVLCGHTHSRGSYRPMPNLEVRVAGAEYGRPEVADILTVAG